MGFHMLRSFFGCWRLNIHILIVIRKLPSFLIISRATSSSTLSPDTQIVIPTHVFHPHIPDILIPHLYHLLNSSRNVRPNMPHAQENGAMVNGDAPSSKTLSVSYTHVLTHLTLSYLLHHYALKPPQALSELD